MPNNCVNSPRLRHYCFTCCTLFRDSRMRTHFVIHNNNYCSRQFSSMWVVECTLCTDAITYSCTPSMQLNESQLMLATSFSWAYSFKAVHSRLIPASKRVLLTLYSLWVMDSYQTRLHLGIYGYCVYSCRASPSTILHRTVGAIQHTTTINTKVWWCYILHNRAPMCLNIYWYKCPLVR